MRVVAMVHSAPVAAEAAGFALDEGRAEPRAGADSHANALAICSTSALSLKTFTIAEMVNPKHNTNTAN